MTSPTILRMNDLTAQLGLARSTIYKMVRSGDFPPPVKLTGRASGWHSHEIEAFVQGLKSHSPHTSTKP
ncbi:AlpA family phage regulatory protein [Thermomonas sp. HDW16]|nr:AlpA family phage regulatory protein [Thermomonas sp. HDW16]